MKKNQKTFSPIQILMGFVTFSLIVLIGWLIWQQSHNKSVKAIDSFEACAAAGNPIMTSYPEMCSANGKTFTNPEQVVSSDSIYVTLTDKTNGMPLTLRKVNIYSDDNIRCIQAPCPGNSEHWSDTTDENGIITIPKQDIYSQVIVSPEGFRGEKLQYDKTKSSYTMEFEFGEN